MISPAELPELFLKYDYAGAIDLAKAFLGLNTAVLVFSLTFASRVVGRRPGWRPAKAAMIGAWSTFLLAIATVGLAIFGLALAAGRAIYGGNFQDIASRAYTLMMGAGLLFMLALSGLFASAVLAMRLREAAPGGVQRGAQSS